MLGREPVVDRQRARIGRSRDSRDHCAMRVDRSDYVSAAVQIEDHSIRIRAQRRDPFRVDAARVDLLANYVGWNALADSFHPGAPLRHGRIRILRGRLDSLDYLAELLARHLSLRAIRGLQRRLYHEMAHDRLRRRIQKTSGPVTHRATGPTLETCLRF